jgi:hypothetical protein
MRRYIGLVTLVGLVAASLSAANAAPTVTLKSLLLEMVDRDAVAKLPSPAYTCRQASSHDARKNDPGNPANWHSNEDFGNFIHTEVNEGRREWVIMEHEGPGAIVRFWTPLLADKDKQNIRFYFDGSSTPAITAKFNDLLSGQGFVRPPLACTAMTGTDLRDQLKAGFKAPRGVGGDLYLPIPYARGCKITLDSAPFYYVINYRGYRPGTDVRTFSMAQVDAEKATLKRVSDTLGGRPAPGVKAQARRAMLAPGEALAMDLPAGSRAVRSLQVHLSPAEAGQALRATVLEASFDGEATVWCPLSEFFGAGVRLYPVQDWWRTVAADGTLTARWVMPYQRTGSVALRNVGAKPMTVTLAVAVGPWAWDGRSLHFHANWRCQIGTKTRPIADWNTLDARGSGIYVGDTLTVFNPVGAWYGEGDERIYVDGATFPAHIGTGTEDYYGYAWGMAGWFSSPFMSMPKRDRAPTGDWQGYTTTSRVRLLDGIPMRTGIKHDMEIWHWADTKVDYAAGTFWYARPGATHNRPTQPTEAGAPLSELLPPFAMAGAVEFETLSVAAKSPNLIIGTQDAGLSEGQWSGGMQLFVQAGKVGDFVEFDVPVAGTQPCALTLYGTRSRDYGILRFTVNGQPAGHDFDAFHLEAVPTGPVELGTFTPVGGKLRLRGEVVGSNPASTGPRYYFGLDCIVAR